VEGSPIQIRDWAAKRSSEEAQARVEDPHGSKKSRNERELELARRAAEGDPVAQNALVQLLLPRVRRITRAFFRGPADADDAAQLSLLAILKSVPSFRGESSLGHWAKRIVVRTTLRHLERERRKQRPVVTSEADQLAGTSASVDHEGLPRELRAYLEELPEAQRDALVLHHALGHSIAEIAEMTEVSPNTVKGRLRLGANTLRKRVRQELLVGRRKEPTP
jgi:RNA polymerase sigma-70 factor (ECF subfamily)